MDLDSRLDWSDEKKAKKAMLSIAITTIIFANLQIELGSTLSIFGLRIAADQIQIVAFGQLATSLLLVVFIARVLPSQLQLFLQNKMSDLEKRQEKLKVATSRNEKPKSLREALDEIPEHARKIVFALNTAELSRYSGWIVRAEIFALILVDNLIPLSIASAAILKPRLAGETATMLFN